MRATRDCGKGDDQSWWCMEALRGMETPGIRMLRVVEDLDYSTMRESATRILIVQVVLAGTSWNNLTARTDLSLCPANQSTQGW